MRKWARQGLCSVLRQMTTLTKIACDCVGGTSHRFPCTRPPSTYFRRSCQDAVKSSSEQEPIHDSRFPVWHVLAAFGWQDARRTSLNAKVLRLRDILIRNGMLQVAVCFARRLVNQQRLVQSPTTEVVFTVLSKWPRATDAEPPWAPFWAPGAGAGSAWNGWALAAGAESRASKLLVRRRAITLLT